jgi:hypothetical protein
MKKRYRRLHKNRNRDGKRQKFTCIDGRLNQGRGRDDGKEAAAKVKPDIVNEN